MRFEKKLYLIVLLIISVTLLVYYAEKNKIPYYFAYRYLYFLPIIFSSFFYGINGGLQTSLVISSLYIPILILNLQKGFIPYNLEVLITILLFNIVAALLGYLADMERKQKEVSEEIIKFAGCGILVIDREGVIKVLNEQTRKLLKCEGNILPEDLQPVINHIINETKNKEYANFEFNWERKSETVPILFNASRILGGENIIIACQDLSEKRKLITLEELNRLKSEFVSAVSHELKSPLTSIKGFLSTLLLENKNNKSTPTDEFYQIIDSETERLLRLINDLLCIPRIEEGQDLKLQIKSIEIYPMIKKIVNFQRIFTDRHKFVIEVKDENIRVLADEDKLEQILNNLLENAMKYSPAGGKITISVDKKDDIIITAIEDEGMGIPENEITKIFEKYHRIESEETKGITGAGIGLYIIKEILEMQNGKIWVESKIGEGSKFYFTLPSTE